MQTSTTDLVNRAKEIVEQEVKGVQALSDQLDENLVDVIQLLLNCQGHCWRPGPAPLGL